MSCCDETQLCGVMCRAGVPRGRAAMVVVGFSSHFSLVESVSLTVDQMGDGTGRADVCHKISSASLHTTKSV